ncbi:hypothetical protein SLE2022_249110 [Rubroshorea leprosula]
MLVLLFDVIFFFFSTLSIILARLIVSSVFLVVQVIQLFKVPGEAIQGGLEQLAEIIKVCFEFVFDIVKEIIASIISAIFEHLKEAAKESAAEMVSTVFDLMKNTRTSLDDLLKDLPEIAEGFSGMIQTVTTNLWESYKDVIKYLLENAN